MAVKLISLRGLPEDEIEEIRELLEKNHVSFYETPGGNWGISMPAFWLREESTLTYCKGLLETYQRERYERVHAEFLERKQRGEVEGIADRVKQQPVKVLVYVACLVLIVYVSTMPFVDIGS